MVSQQGQDTYTGLTRDQEESERLNLQHDLYIKSTGFHLHPRIAATLPTDAHIAEVATGTGIWLRSLAAASSLSSPGWKFSGFDLSAEQFPPEPERKGVDFRVLDILKPPPEEERGKYDMVHVRLLVCGLKGSDWRRAATNIRALLKPGGWVQWHEGTFAELHFMQFTPLAPYPSASREVAQYAVRSKRERRQSPNGRCPGTTADGGGRRVCGRRAVFVFFGSGGGGGDAEVGHPGRDRGYDCVG
ncbi:hypothetical protein KC349_g5603 [Hortaea werneckii]|nr:hypothetical protein KC349_g5603 [Hortaea werneckii]